METTNDTTMDSVIVYVEQDIHAISDSALVEEVLHRYDKISDDLKAHDSTPALVSIIALIAIILSILNRRKKNKKDGTQIH